MYPPPSHRGSGALDPEDRGRSLGNAPVVAHEETQVPIGGGLNTDTPADADLRRRNRPPGQKNQRLDREVVTIERVRDAQRLTEPARTRGEGMLAAAPTRHLVV